MPTFMGGLPLFALFTCLEYHSYNNVIYNYFYRGKSCLLTGTKNSLS